MDYDDRELAALLADMSDDNDDESDVKPSPLINHSYQMSDSDDEEEETRLMTQIITSYR